MNTFISQNEMGTIYSFRPPLATISLAQINSGRPNRLKYTIERYYNTYLHPNN